MMPPGCGRCRSRGMQTLGTPHPASGISNHIQADPPTNTQVSNTLVYKIIRSLQLRSGGTRTAGTWPVIIAAGAPGGQLCWSGPRTRFSARTGGARSNPNTAMAQ